MKLIDIEQLEFEPFNFGDDENPKIVNYISEGDLQNAPEIDPVKHARWVVKAGPMYTESGKISVGSYCSNCNALGHVDIVPDDLWEMGYKDSYSPKRNNFCANCGRKMDLPDKRTF